jgi:SAM-dependent methyltransferase
MSLEPSIEPSRSSVGSPAGQTRGADRYVQQSHLAYHLGQYERPYRSTEHFARFVESLPLERGEALDVACGAGANIAYLAHRLPGFRWSGLDYFGDSLFEHARPKLVARNVDAKLVSGDLYELTRHFPPHRFELVTCIQTLAWLPDWRAALAQMMAITRGWLVVSSLFTDSDVEAMSQATDFTLADAEPQHIVILSLARVRAFCQARGADEVRSQDFEIDIDLQPPSAGGLGTYTRTLDSGARLQFTGPMYMPWKFVAIHMTDDANPVADR